MAGFAIAGLAIAGLAMAGLAIAGVNDVTTAGFANPKLSGSRICGAFGSGLNVTKPVRPPITKAPFGAVISCAFTVTLAVGFADWMNTARATLDCAATVTSSDDC